MKKRMLLVLTAAVLAAIAGCTSKPDLLNAGTLILETRALGLIRGEFGYLQNPEWENAPGSEGLFTNDRIPEWAQDTYTDCVYWEDGITYMAIGRTGRSRGTGVVRGWILIDASLNTHILEITYDEEGGPSHRLIDAWEEPEHAG